MECLSPSNMGPCKKIIIINKLEISEILVKG